MDRDSSIALEEIRQLLQEADLETLKNISDFLELAPAEDTTKMYNDIIDKLSVLYNEWDADDCFRVNTTIQAIIEPPQREDKPIFIQDDEIELDVPRMYYKVTETEIED